MATYGGHLPEGLVGGDSEVWSGQVADGGLADVSGLTLRDLRDMRDADGKSSLSRALSRLLSRAQAEGHHGFQSKI